MLATLTMCEPVEMFWLGCHFEPTDAFTEVESLFREATDYGDDHELFNRNYATLKRMGVVLIDTENDLVIDTFTLHILEDEVQIRYRDPRHQMTQD